MKSVADSSAVQTANAVVGKPSEVDTDAAKDKSGDADGIERHVMGL